MVKNVDAVELRIFIVAVLVAAVDAVLVTHHSTLRQYLATRKREVNYLLGVEKIEGGIVSATATIHRAAGFVLATVTLNNRKPNQRPC